MCRMQPHAALTRTRPIMKARHGRPAEITTAIARSYAKQKQQVPVQTLPEVTPGWPALLQLSSKQKVVLASTLGFALSNMDKTNFTVAVIPMALTYGWSPITAGLVQSAFFYGFLLMQLPGGSLSTRLGGAFMLPRGIAVFSAATAAIPLAAGSLPALCAVRAVMGAGEAVAPSSIIDMLTRTVPSAERASAVSTAFAGLHIGSIVGLLMSPLIINAAGWETLFATCGAAGLVWLFWFRNVMDEIQASDPELHAQLLPTINSDVTSGQPAAGIPYRAFLRNRSVQALGFTHFCHNWLHYTMLAWLPSYLSATLEMDLTHAAHTALLPPIAGVIASAAAGYMGDTLIARGVPVAGVRKLAQTVGFIVPAVLLGAATQVHCSPNDMTAVACITAALGVSSFSLAGLYCTHGDLSPKYSSALLSLTNVSGSLPGMFGVAAVGALLELSNNDWNVALFMPSAALLIAGTVAYAVGVSHEPVDFDVADNRPFVFERRLRRWKSPGVWRAAVLRVARGLGKVVGAGADVLLQGNPPMQGPLQEGKPEISVRGKGKDSSI